MNNEDPNNLNDETKTTEQKFDKAKQIAKSVGKFVFRHWKLVLIVALIVVIMLIIFVGASYLIVLIDGTEDSSSSSNVPASASSYTDSVSTNEDGELVTDSTVQELWDELVDNGSDIGDYLDSAEELAKLINAELITQNVDTREDPDEEITDEDWEEIISEMTGVSSEDEDSDEESENTEATENTDEDTITNVQGIIKFKRATADDDGNYEGSTTMTYVDNATFYGWIEDYNVNGSSDAKENLLTHFTLQGTSSSSSTSSSLSSSSYASLDYSESQWTNISEAIVTAALTTPTTGNGWCLKWVNYVYVNAGFDGMWEDGAYQAYEKWCISTSTDNIPIGAVVWGTGSDWSYKGSVNTFGHVGIYIGDYDGDGEGDVIDSTGTVKIQSLSEWIAWQEEAANPGLDETPGWLGWGWGNIGNTELSLITDEDEIEEIEARLDTVEATSDVSITNSGSSVSSGTYYAVVATWNEIIYDEDTDDPDRTEEAEENDYKTYSVSTTKIDYKNLTSGYTMPFNYLWEFLVITENKDFVMALADLVYDSEIEITIYDNETVNTNIETITYKVERETETSVDKVYFDWEISATYNVEGSSYPYTYKNDTDGVGTYDSYRENQPITSEEYYYTYTTTTTTNTLNVELTKANVWMADYEVEEITSTETKGDENSSEKVTLNDETIADKVKYNDEDFIYGQDSITAIKSVAWEKIIEEVEGAYSNEIQALDDAGCDPEVTATYKSMSGISHIYTEKRIERETQTSDTTDTTKFTLSPVTVTEKTDKDSEEPNFVTLFIEYRGARSSVLELWSWLMEIMEANEDTVDLVDLTKYLVYKATGKDYGVTEFDFESLYESAYESLTSVSSGDFIVNTEMSDSSIVITDLETLKTAFSGYTTSAKLIEYAEYFLEYQEEYKVNAVFAAGVSIKETTAGTAGHATDGKNNWFNIICTCGNSSHGTYETYSSAQESIEAFFALIAKEGSESHYFGQGLYTVSEIGAVYCPNTPEYPTQADTWIEFVTEYMTKMYNAAGISILSSALEVADGTKAEKLSYLFPNGVPTSQSTMSTYMASVKVALTTKTRNEDDWNDYST